MNVQRLILILLAAGALSAYGCRTVQDTGIPLGNDTPFDPKPAENNIVLQRNIQFADLPVPKGYALVPEKVFTHRGSTFRFGRLFYQGTWTVRGTSVWYRQQMPLFGWSREGTEILEDYHVKEHYRKGRERVTVEIQGEELTHLTLHVETLRGDEREAPSPAMNPQGVDEHTVEEGEVIEEFEMGADATPRARGSSNMVTVIETRPAVPSTAPAARDGILIDAPGPILRPSPAPVY